MMNILKYHFRKKYLHNRNQGWINLTLLAVATVLLCCHKPACQWVMETIDNNLLLTLTICTVLLVSFLLSRIYCVDRIRNGQVKARGCAGSSCLMTLLMFLCLVILTIKTCNHHYSPAPQDAAKELAHSPSPASTAGISK